MADIYTNLAANSALYYLNLNSSNESITISQLASGLRVVPSSVDPSALAIGSQLLSQIGQLNQDTINVNQGNAIQQSTDGALAQISNILQSMLALATQSASGQTTRTQRTQSINTTYQQLKTQISTIVNSTTYAGQKLLSGSFLSNVKYLVGTSSSHTITVSVPNVVPTTLLASASTVSTAALASAAITVISAAINTITLDRAKVGAYESRFSFQGQDISSAVTSLQASFAAIDDVDVALAKAQLATQDVLTQGAIAALTQAAALPQELLKFLQSAS